MLGKVLRGLRAEHPTEEAVTEVVELPNGGHSLGELDVLVEKVLNLENVKDIRELRPLLQKA